MNEISKFRQDEALRMLRWIRDNPEAWYRICISSEDFMKPDECAKYIEVMEENELYSIIPIILFNNRGQRQTGRGIDKFIIKNIIDNCERNGVKKVVGELKASVYAESLVEK